MKKVLSLVVVTLFILSGCSIVNYDNKNWNTYQLSNPNRTTFQYPDDWKKGYTDNNLLYFYQDNDDGSKRIMAFQSDPFSDYDYKGEEMIETNAFSKSFKKICLKDSGTGPIPDVHYGIDEISADGDIADMKFLDFSSIDAETNEIICNLKLYFTDEVSGDIFIKIMMSCN